ncbi:DUF2484 family protein [bacterium]|nr:DUF2484 family protein [bacterium]
MTTTILALFWLILANLIAMLPSRDHHWRAAYVLMSLGLPLAVCLYQARGLSWTLAFLLAAASILRWPLYHAWRWMRGVVGR